jgi:hypothetical protein
VESSRNTIAVAAAAAANYSVLLQACLASRHCLSFTV